MDSYEKQKLENELKDKMERRQEPTKSEERREFAQRFRDGIEEGVLVKDKDGSYTFH
jgi:hypothetical protein